MNDIISRIVDRIIQATIPSIAYGRYSYSQEGEDLALARLLGVRKKGFYVDVGSHHPQRFSNSYHFYRMGWRGICIDPAPGMAAVFRRQRPRDIAVEIGVSVSAGMLTYHIFNDPALNTFDPALAAQRAEMADYYLVETREISTAPLSEIIIDVGLDPLPQVDFLSVDVEGFDLQVLQSNDWDSLRPNIVIAECIGLSIGDVDNGDVSKFMREVGYFSHAKLGQSVIFVRKDAGLW